MRTRSTEARPRRLPVRLCPWPLGAARREVQARSLSDPNVDLHVHVRHESAAMDSLDLGCPARCNTQVSRLILSLDCGCTRYACVVWARNAHVYRMVRAKPKGLAAAVFRTGTLCCERVVGPTERVRGAAQCLVRVQLYGRTAVGSTVSVTC